MRFFSIEGYCVDENKVRDIDLTIVHCQILDDLHTKFFLMVFRIDNVLTWDLV
jgi:hypothetical protein